MADERDTTGCAAVGDDLELFVLGALDPAEVAPVEAHLEGCRACRSEVEATEAALGALLAAVPPAEVPDALVARAMAAGSPPAAAPPVASPPGRPTPGRRRRLALVAVAAVVVVLAAVAAVGALRSSGGSGEVAVPSTAAVGRSAALVTSDGRPIGSVVVTSGDGASLAMTVDRAPAGVAYDCVVRGPSGDLVTVGSWTTTGEGPATWSVALDPELAPVDEVRLVVPGAGTIATARPA